ncbi:MAG: hypothetical protein WCT05_04910 [Lentisphaeria bacterium]
MKKKAQNPSAETPGDDWNCPFRNLQIKIVEPPSPPKPLSPPPVQDKPKLGREDQELLKAFSKAGELPALSESGNTSRQTRGYQLRFTLQRKGKGGKTVTHVHGLKALDIPEQMTICSDIRADLGIGARFLDGLLELQGDQCLRAKKWFADKGFSTL